MNTLAPAVPQMVAEPDRLAALAAYDILDTPAEEGFDEIVQLASILCETPVALVSLVAADRQWFKARIGFPRCETDLNSSVCAHALVEPDLLVIADLTADPRTQHNPLVTGEPHIRFYAGAPLRTAAGHTLGSLCVIDALPRPGGLTQKQVEGLRALGREVVSQLELRRLLRDRDVLVRKQLQTQSLLQAQTELLQTVTDNVVGQAIFQMDDLGIVTFANPAAAAMFGYARDEMLGWKLHDLIHHSYPDGTPYPADACELTQALIRGRLIEESPQIFFRKNGAALHVLVTVAPVVTDGVIKGAVLTVANVTERKAAEAKLAASEAHWRGLFERLEEGLVIGQVLRDATGTITDWRYLEVNPAWAGLVGLPVCEAIGRTLRELLPEVDDEWVSEPGWVVTSGQSVSFTRHVPRLGKWFEGRVSPLGPDKFVMLFLDVTERILTERSVAANADRRAALARLGDALRTTMSSNAMGYTTGAIIGPILNAAQAGYASIDAARETVDIGPTWLARGTSATSVSGLHSFRDYGSFIDDLKAGHLVVIPDVRRDERTRAHVKRFEALGVVALINAPIVEHGELVAVLLVLFDAPRALSKEEQEFVCSAADRSRVGIARIRAEEQQAILNGEISHRLKNSMAMIQAIANQTLKGVADRDAVTSFERRLMALSTAHDVLLQRDWETADLDEVVRRVLDAAGAKGRYDSDGSDVKLGPRAALSTSLLLHELATNASKYGALTEAAGRIEVAWRVEKAANIEELVLDWREIGGPPAKEPTRKGFGSRLLRMGLVGTGGSRIDYGKTGLSATFRAPRKHVEQA